MIHLIRLQVKHIVTYTGTWLMCLPLTVLHFLCFVRPKTGTIDNLSILLKKIGFFLFEEDGERINYISAVAIEIQDDKRC